MSRTMIRCNSSKHQRLGNDDGDEELLLPQASNRSSDWERVVEKPSFAEKMIPDAVSARRPQKTREEEQGAIEPFSSEHDIEQTLLIFEESAPCENNNDEFKNEGSLGEPSPTRPGAHSAPGVHVRASEGESQMYSLPEVIEAGVVVKEADVEAQVQQHLYLNFDKMAAARAHEELMQRAERATDASINSSVGNEDNDGKPTRKRRMFFYALPVVLVALVVAIVVGVVVSKGKTTASNSTVGKCSFCADGTMPPNLDAKRVDQSKTCSSFMESQVTLDATNPQCEQAQALAWMFCDCPTLPPPKRDDSACEFCPDGAQSVGQDCANLHVVVALVGSSPFMTCDDIIATVSANCTCPNLDAVERFNRLLRPISGDAIDDSASPQFQALNWIANIDPAGLSVEQDSAQVIRQRYVAAVLYFAMGGESWTDQRNFLSADKTCLWNVDDFGIGCDALDGVTSFRLPDNSLLGEMPGELGYYSNLATVDLQANALTGTIPEAISGLVSLDEINLSDNALTGTIPSALFNLLRLRSIDLSQNAISGQLPASVGNATKLESLLLHENGLTGTIPPAVGQSTILRHLDVDSNNFTGSIPEFSPSSAMEQLLAGVNNLVGTIPASVGSLRQLQVLSVGYNELEGPIPDFSANEGSLAIIELWKNRLTGSLDRLLTTTPPQSLTHIRVEANMLTGTISTAIGRFKNLSELRLSQNKLMGTIPTQLGLLTKMSTLIYLWDNGLSGTIPSELGLLTNLENGLILAVNQLTGTIPTQLGSLSMMKELVLNQNLLTGIVPTELGNCLNLSRLWMPTNNLSGNVSVLLNALPRTLHELDLSQNSFSGTIPTIVGDFMDLEAFDIFSNQLVGSLPSELGRLTNLTGLQLNDNFLDGTIPATLGNCTLLELLSLDVNAFVGIVPTQLAQLSSLGSLFVFDNALTGSVDALCGKQFDVFAANSCDATNNTLECSCCTHCCYTDSASCDEL